MRLVYAMLNDEGALIASDSIEFQPNGEEINRAVEINRESKTFYSFALWFRVVEATPIRLRKRPIRDDPQA